MGDEGESSGRMLGKFGAAFGKTAAKAGKKAAQSEAGRRATGAAVRGACDGVRDDMTGRYGVPSPTSPMAHVPTPTSAAEKMKKSAPPPLPQAPSNSDDDITINTTTHHSIPPKPFHSLRLRLHLGGGGGGGGGRRPVRQQPSPRRVRPVKEPNWDRLPLAQTLYNFKGEQKCDLEFRKGQVIQVMTLTESQDDWWEGKLEDRIGIFPANYVRVM